MCASPITATALPSASRNCPSARHSPSLNKKLCRASSAMHGHAVGGRLAPFVHRVVAQHAGDAQAVGREDARAPLLLRFAMLLHVAPLAHALFVFPELQRHELARRGDALESLQRKETFRLVELGLELGHELHVVGKAPLAEREFEDDRDHALPPQARRNNSIGWARPLTGTGPSACVAAGSSPAAARTSRDARIEEP